MIYSYNPEILMKGVDREIARVASTSAAEDGSSLYDGIINGSRDKDILMGYMNIAYSGFITRIADLAYPMGDTLQINAPDFDSAKESVVTNLISTYLVNNTVASWMLEKGSPKSESYAALSSANIDNIVTLLKTRIKPTRI